MNIKSRKIVLNDEVAEFLMKMDLQNQKNPERKNYEKEFKNYLQQNYSIMPLDKLKEFILLVNTFPLLTEEKFKIVNFKPKSIIELDLLINNSEGRLTKPQINQLFEFIKNNCSTEMTLN